MSHSDLPPSSNAPVYPDRTPPWVAPVIAVFAILAMICLIGWIIAAHDGDGDDQATPRASITKTVTPKSPRASVKPIGPLVSGEYGHQLNVIRFTPQSGADHTFSIALTVMNTGNAEIPLTQYTVTATDASGKNVVASASGVLHQIKAGAQASSVAVSRQAMPDTRGLTYSVVFN